MGLVRSSIHRQLIVALSLACLATACLQVEPAWAETTLERISRSGEVRIGYAREAPFAFRTPDGRLTGIGPEVARRVFAAMGIREVKGVESEFGTLIRDLLAGRFDVIAAGMFVLPERCRKIAFSEPSYRAGPGFAVRPGNPKSLHGLDDVARDRSVRLGVVAGAVEREYALANGVAEEQLVMFPDARAAADGVRAGRADAYAAVGLTIEDLIRRTPRQIERAQPFRTPVLNGRNFTDHGAYGFRPEDVDLRGAFNRRLVEFLRTPEYLDVVAPFGITRDELPDRTTAELCAER